ncbi:hypothetical protein BCR44DRAFT_35068 [Catenaria anguillulae PL171]|uniref:Uncharacterized protein n=1 Tax=Catenaria anguillulae PL171 TaxID=765915 RepID=A0A1Y2HGD3_9FUNG|nr:hypothetical protein BCR44DRAFT_35068 [Catenaria anguillulae PL171]
MCDIIRDTFAAMRELGGHKRESPPTSRLPETMPLARKWASMFGKRTGARRCADPLERLRILAATTFHG